MSSPSKDLKETESALRSVIQVLIDGQEGFKKIGEQIKDEALKEYFLAESLTRAQFRGVLESILHQEGVHDVKESGTAAGTFLRAWGDLKSALGGGDPACCQPRKRRRRGHRSVRKGDRKSICHFRAPGA